MQRWPCVYLTTALVKSLVQKSHLLLFKVLFAVAWHRVGTVSDCRLSTLALLEKSGCYQLSMNDTFTPIDNRDAWATIRGFVYQFDTTLLRWIALKPTRGCVSNWTKNYGKGLRGRRPLTSTSAGNWKE